MIRGNSMGKEIKSKAPMPKQVIFKIMLTVTYAVAAIFLLKNILGKELVASLVIAAVLLIFSAVLFIMYKAKKSDESKYFGVSLSLLVVICMISLFSGANYSDEFILYLAAMILSGMFMQPKITLIQLMEADVLLIVMYVIHPEKAESLGQYIMCFAIFTLAGYLLYLTIKRGQAYIALSDKRAEEAERLLQSLVLLGNNLQDTYVKSYSRIEKLETANEQLETSTAELQNGSANLLQEAEAVRSTCDQVRGRIKDTKQQISDLNADVMKFEEALSKNHQSMDEMNAQMQAVQATMHEINEVFTLMNKQVAEIYSVTEQMNSISNNTTMLALNASIEAARAGQAGAGFAVVASKVQELAVNSNRCSDQVAKVVALMDEQILRTSQQLEESSQVINGSLESLEGLKESNNQLTQRFANLYFNIAAQNDNVEQVSASFDELRGKVDAMGEVSEENSNAVASISNALIVYQNNMEQVIDDTKGIHELSVSMLAITNEQEEDGE